MYEGGLLCCREEKERAATAAADAAEAQSAPAAEGKEAADKAAKKLEGNARCVIATCMMHHQPMLCANFQQTLSQCSQINC